LLKNNFIEGAKIIFALENAIIKKIAENDRLFWKNIGKNSN